MVADLHETIELKALQWLRMLGRAQKVSFLHRIDIYVCCESQPFGLKKLSKPENMPKGRRTAKWKANPEV